MKLYYLLPIAILLLFSACRKDEVITDTIITDPGPIETTEVDILGIVTDLDGNPLEDATITFGSAQASSDQNGVFQIKGLATGQAVLQVGKSGYFTTYPAFIPTGSNAIQQVNVRLMERSLTTSFSATSGGLAELPSGAKVDFVADGFIDANGNKYTGEVNVYAAYLDPTDPLLDEYMPGNLTAIDNDDQIRALLTYGMVNVELEDPSGQPLQIDQPATIEMPLPVSLQGNAPAEIPLWYFDEVAGLWVEEGSAQKEGDRYVGTVPHFSFWNCDVPYDYVNLTGELDASGGADVNALKVCVTWLDQNDTQCGYTDFKGFFEGLVPQDALLLIEVYDNCNDVIYSEQIGPFSTDTDLGMIPVTLNDNWAMVSGNVIDCNLQPVTDGYAYIDLSGNGLGAVIPVDASGNFSSTVNYCNAGEVAISGINIEASEYGDPVTYPTGPVIQADDLTACGNQFVASVVLEYDGNTHIIDNCIVDVEYDVNDNPQIYTFTSVDNPNDIIYQFTFLNWTSGEPVPVWGLATQITELDDPGDTFIVSDGEIELTVEGYSPNDLIQFKVINCNIENTATSQTYSNSTMTITGVVQ